MATKSKRKKTLVEQELTWVQVQGKLEEYAGVSDLLTVTEAELESKLDDLRAKYNEEIAKLKSDQNLLLKELKKWAVRNKKTLFQVKKSKETLFGKLGFRTGTHKLKLQKGMKWDDVLAKVKEFAPNYLRTKESVAKDKLLSDREGEGMDSVFASIGVEVTQDEAFFIELKTETSDNEEG